MDIQLESVFSMFYQPDECISGFSYSSHEMIYFCNGCGRVRINKTDYKYEKNSVLLMKNTDIKDYVAESYTEYICIRFKSKKEIQMLQSGIYPLGNDIVHRLFLRIVEEYTNKKLRYYDLCNVIIVEILIQLERESRVENKDKDIYQLINEIDSSLIFRKNVFDISKEMNYNYDYLRQKFKKITGVSIKKYIIQQRIRNACALLEEKNYSCTEIAQMCGFASSSQFSRIFKEEMGYSPKFYHGE